MLYLTLLIIAIGYLVYWYITRNFNYWKKRNVVGPEPVPLFGNIMDSALRRSFIGTIMQKIYLQYPNKKIVGIYRMTSPAILLRDFEIIKHVMIKDFDLFTDRGVQFSKEGLGANLFHADGETWRVLRTRFTPLFTSGKLKNMFQLISERVDKSIHYLQGKTELEQDMHSFARMYTMSAISTCAFGIDLDFNDPRMAVLNRLDKLILNLSHILEFDMMYPGFLKKINVSIFPAEVTKFFHDLVKTVFSQRNNMPSDRNDFMDLILQMRQQKVIHARKNIDQSELALELTEELIAAQAAVFFSAGFETSSTTIALLLYELTRNPEVQDKLIAEIDEVLKNNDGKVDYDVLMEMTYLGQVMDETLRKYPVVDPLQRQAKVDYKVPGTDVTIKKGQLIIIPLLGIHYDPNLYPNPEVFDPERFTVENSKNRHPCAYMPFGMGPRNCIGLRFAKVQSRLFVVKMLSKYRVESSSKTPKEIRFDPGRFVLGPRDGVSIKIVSRHISR